MMKLLDKVLIRILAVLAGLSSAVLIGMLIAARISPETIETAFSSIVRSCSAGWILIALSAVVLALAVILLVRLGKHDGRKGNMVEIGNGEAGVIYLSTDTLEAMIRSACARHPEIEACKSKITSGDGINAEVRLTIQPETDIVTLGAAVQKDIADSLHNNAGLQLNNLRIFFEQMRKDA